MENCLYKFLLEGSIILSEVVVYFWDISVNLIGGLVMGDFIGFCEI